MLFKAEISLDNAEAAEATDLALSAYLRDMAQQAASGSVTGQVRDGNGNMIGAWWLEEDAGTCAQCGAEVGTGNGCRTCDIAGTPVDG